ncbi:uncharacterized protein BX663DRAFT_511071 [Cokeromyces recurvatus]|uniref:uncharacterized protein n=1 Tax=Cokeromyces recurvatus TaxID=90255 RepID=UPI0022202BCE|nr:uncharacterized protein BX663DRAFT_511071 [Cokeromyces recurvatus]KAI7902438.1 hypothetical protein BX663DRAFT_511071 [Cokeromyces recurvatus]
MSRLCATAFQSLPKPLVQEIRFKTLNLYKSLLQSSQHYPPGQLLKEGIRKEFKKNKYNTSRKKISVLLTEAEKTLDYLEKGKKDETIASKIVEYVKKYTKKETKKKKPAIIQVKKKPKMTKRKRYQVAITTRTAHGFEFKRVRGWVQPVQTSMMLKKRVKTNQARIDKSDKLKEELNMIRMEERFLRQLNCLPKEGLIDYEINIKEALTELSKYRFMKKEQEETLEEVEEL